MPTLAIGFVLFRIRHPDSLIAWLAFALSSFLAIGLSFCLHFMITVIGSWTTAGRGIMGMVLLAVNFLTGFLAPLDFFTPTLRVVVISLPFAGMIDTPTKVFLQQAQGLELVVLLVQQLCWVVVFIAAAHLLLHRATRKLVVQGRKRAHLFPTCGRTAALVERYGGGGK